MNTAVSLMYRDACNYKTTQSYIFEGAPKASLVEQLLASRDGYDGESILPTQVGLAHPAVFNDIFAGRWPDEEDDHMWVEFGADSIVPTDEEPTENVTFRAFVGRCVALSEQGWDETAALAEAGGWQDPEKCAALRGGSDD
jgi:hypothetical protein